MSDTINIYVSGQTETIYINPVAISGVVEGPITIVTSGQTDNIYITPTNLSGMIGEIVDVSISEIGEKGDTGRAATITVGNVITSGESAIIINSGTVYDAVFDFVIPKGDTGPQGTQGIQGIQGEQGIQGLSGISPTISIGTVAKGDEASVTNTGTPDAAIFNFILPKGDQGIQGIQGLQGIQGIQGLPGDKGDQGDTGPQGIQGISGMPGHSPVLSWVSDQISIDGTISGPHLTGPTGLTGAVGPKGEDSTVPGPQGIQGERGEKGDPGIVIPAGNDEEIQFNNAGSIGADSKFKWNKTASSLHIGEGVEVLPQNPLAVQANIDSYLQTTMKNDSNGTSASSDFVLTADNGNDTLHYADFGINSSQYSNEEYLIYSPNDAYLFASDDDLVIGTFGDGKKVKFHTVVSGEATVVAEINNTGISVPSGMIYSIGNENIQQSDFDRHSAGLVSGGELSVGSPNTTLTVSSGIGWAWNGTKFVRVVWDSFLNQTVTLTQYNYVSIYYDGTLVLSAVPYTTNNYINLGHILKNATTGVITSIWPTPDRIGDYQRYNNQFVSDIFGTILSSGFIVSEQAIPNELHLSISEGTLYSKLSSFTHSTKTSFYKLMNCTDRGLTADLVNNDSIVNTSLWCDSTKTYATALTTMTDGYWAKAMVITSVGGNIFYVYPQAEYATEDLAKSAPLPSASQLRADGNALLASIVFTKGDTSIASRIYDIRPIMERAFGTEVSSAGGTVVDHGSLTGLSDDDHTQYYNSSRIETWFSTKTQDNLADGTTYKRFSDTEKTKLSGIEAGAEVNVQPDWNQSDTGADDYIKNKPIIGSSGFTYLDIGVTVDGGGSVITTGSKGYREIAENCTIIGWTVLAKESGSCVIDVKKSTYSGFPSTSSITGTEKPTLTSAQKSQDLSLSTWTTNLSQGDVLEFTVDSVSTITRVTLLLRIQKI